MSSPGWLAPFPRRLLHKSLGPTGAEKELSLLLQRHMIGGGPGDQAEGGWPVSLQPSSLGIRGLYSTTCTSEPPQAPISPWSSSSSPLLSSWVSPAQRGSCDYDVLMKLELGVGSATDSQDESQAPKKKEMLVSSASFSSPGLILPSRVNVTVPHVTSPLAL